MLDLLRVARAHMVVKHVAVVVVRAVVSTVEAGTSELAVVSGQSGLRNGFGYVDLVVKGSIVRADWRREMGEELRRRRNLRRSSNCWKRWRIRRKPLLQVFSLTRYRTFPLVTGYIPRGGF